MRIDQSVSLPSRYVAKSHLTRVRRMNEETVKFW